jgi:hypothetical protein
MRDFAMLLLLCRPLRDVVRFEHSRRFGNRIQSKRDAGNNDQTAKDRSSYKRNLTRNIEKPANNWCCIYARKFIK